MTFGENIRDLGSFGEEMDEITDLHQILDEVLLRERGDSVASINDVVMIYSVTANLKSVVSDETIENPNAQIVGDDMVRVHVPRCMLWLNYDEHVDSLSTMDNEVGVTIPESTIQTLSSFEEYTSPVTYSKEVEKTLGTSIEVEPLNKTKQEEVGLNCNQNTPLSSRKVPSFDKLEPQPQPLPNCSPLDASLEIERGLKPPIKPKSPDSFRMKVLDNLTIHTPPSSLVTSFHLRDLYIIAYASMILRNIMDLNQVY
uniref:Uncharacterized protein n=1 Tax=Tanacetum cinerariifolium TaxID=118510 RepID=A0A699GX76_TANCI|nr:hypothetical protein [Tanacetum cinerariifolium]